MVYDWSKKTTRLKMRLFSELSVNGEEHVYFADAQRSPIEYKTFRNFSKLHIEKNQLIGCIFEDCEEVWIDNEWPATDCIFNRVKRIHTKSKALKGCRFCTDENLTSSYLDARDCSISRCIFDGMILMNEALLIEGYGKTYVTSSKFINITSDLIDKAIIKLENPLCELDDGHNYGLDSINWSYDVKGEK